MKDSELLAIIIILIISVGMNIIMGFHLNSANNRFSGDVQQCWDAGGDTFYANKKHSSVSCDQNRVEIKLKD